MISDKQRDAIQGVINTQIAQLEASLRISDQDGPVDLVHWLDERGVERVKQAVPWQRLRARWPDVQRVLQRRAIEFARAFTVPDDVDAGAFIGEIRQSGVRGLWQKQFADPAQVIIDLLNDDTLATDEPARQPEPLNLLGANSPVLTASSSGMLFLAYADDDAVRVTCSLDGGDTWPASSVVAQISGCDAIAAGAMREGLVVAYQEGGRVNCVRSYDLGKTWEERHIFESDVRWLRPHGQIVALHDGIQAVPVTRVDAEGNNCACLAVTRDGLTWSEPLLIADGCSNAALACGSTQTMLVAALQRESSIFSTYSSDLGRTWSAPQRVLNEASSPCLTPRYGYAYLTFCHPGGVDYFPTKDNGHTWWRHLRQTAVTEPDVTVQSTTFVGSRCITAYVRQGETSKAVQLITRIW